MLRTPAALCLCGKSKSSPLDSHKPRPSYSNEPFGKESRQNLCGMMRLVRLRGTKPEIPIVAIFASERADQQQRAHDSLKHAFSPRPAHQVAAATWTRILVAKTYETHTAAFSCARGNNLMGNDDAASQLRGIHKTLYAPHACTAARRAAPRLGVVSKPWRMTPDESPTVRKRSAERTGSAAASPPCW